MGAHCGKNKHPHDPSALIDHQSCIDTSACPDGVTDKATERIPARGSGGRVVSGASISASSVCRRGSYVRMNQKTVHEVYDLEKVVGEGTYGVVWLGTHKLTGVKRAVKSVAKGNRSKEQELMREISTMKNMNHPHIIQLFETFVDKKNLYLAMEICSGGELFDKIIKARNFTEGQAAMIIQQILRAVYYIHSNGYVHRDLKPENFLFHSQEPIETNSLKLIDFGTATECPPGKVCRTKIGTLMYMAPQVLMGRYDQKCDVWSCGVIMYILLSGSPPFKADTDEALQTKIRGGFRKFVEDIWEHISDDAKELIRSLLRMMAHARLTAQQALNHDWVKLQAPRATGKELKEVVGNRLMKFKVKNGLEKAALEVVATQLQDDKIRDLREAFTKLDANGDGKLSLQEMQDGLTTAGMDVSEEQVKKMFTVADADGSGALDYTEFLAATIDRKNLLTKEVMWTAFNVFDLDGDGKISKQEVFQVLESGPVNSHVSGQAILEMIAKFDADGDGNLDFEEFMTMVRGAIRDISGDLSRAATTSSLGSSVLPRLQTGEDSGRSQTLQSTE